MWPKVYFLSTFLVATFAEMTPYGIDRYMSDGVKSAGYKIVYGDEDLMLLNEVVTDMEQNDILKSHVNINEALPPLPPEDVKCMMSVDRYCSKDMGKTKAIIIQAIKDDCKQCSTDEKEKAGKVIASMMAHEPVAWKLFLTRSALIIKPKPPPKEEKVKFRVVGKPEDVASSKHRYVMPGVKVRVRRYAAEKV